MGRGDNYLLTTVIGDYKARSFFFHTRERVCRYFYQCWFYLVYDGRVGKRRLTVWQSILKLYIQYGGYALYFG